MDLMNRKFNYYIKIKIYITIDGKVIYTGENFFIYPKR
jgi:hypothetical protein